MEKAFREKKAKSMNRIKKEKGNVTWCNVSLLTLLEWIRFLLLTCNFEFTGPAVYRKDWNGFHIYLCSWIFQGGGCGRPKSPVHGLGIWLGQTMLALRALSLSSSIFRNLCLAHVETYSPIVRLRIFKISTGQCKVSYVPSSNTGKLGQRSLRRQLA